MYRHELKRISSSNNGGGSDSTQTREAQQREKITVLKLAARQHWFKFINIEQRFFLLAINCKWAHIKRQFAGAVCLCTAAHLCFNYEQNMCIWLRLIKTVNLKPEKRRAYAQAIGM